MISSTVIQVGDVGDAGPRDMDGKQHGEWVWEEPVTYLAQNPVSANGDFVDREFKTKIRMAVDYSHGILIKARLTYDITGKHTEAHEHGKAIGKPLNSGSLPFKNGLWKGYKGKNSLVQTISFYGESSILWEYSKVDGQWTFKKAIVKDGFFDSWERFKPGEFRNPPKEGEWPENFDPFIHIDLLDLKEELFQPESWS